MAAMRSFSRLLARRPFNPVAMRSYANEIKLTFAAANQILYDAKFVKQVDVPTVSGSVSILPKHVPTLAVLKPGVVTVHEIGGALQEVYVSGGTVTVNEDSSVQVLAEEGVPVEKLETSAEENIFNELSRMSTGPVKGIR